MEKSFDTPPSILLVEDDRGLASLIEKRLRREGFEVTHASSGAEALEALQGHQEPFVLVLDYQLPDMHGSQLIEALADKGQHPPFIVTTGHGDERVAVDMMKRGARDYLVKDTSFLDLLPPVVSRVIDDLERERRLEEAEEALRESREHYRRLIDFLPLGIVSIDCEGHYTMVNPVYCRLLGYKEGELLGNSYIDMVIPEPDRAAERELLASMIAKRTLSVGHSFEKAMTRKDGQLRDMRCDVDFLYDEEARVSGFVLAVDDVTERKKVRERLVQSQKDESITMLAGGIAHDFNNILVGVLGNASLLLDEAQGSDESKSLCQSIIVSGERLADLTRQLLAYARGGKYVPRMVNVNESATDTLNMLRGTLRSNISVKCDLDPGICPITADSSQLNQVLLNLCVNACEAMEEEGGQISILTEKITLGADRTCILHEEHQPGVYAHIVVSDTGCGMGPQTLERAFDPFFSTKFTGRGLGLAAVMGIVRNHDGCIAVESEVGRGSKIHLYFPALIEEDMQPPAIAPPPPKQTGATLLLVDDEDIVRQTTGDILKRNGFDVFQAENGERALEVYRAQGDRIDAVLLDVQLPGMSGAEVFAELLKIEPNVKVIVTSGYNIEIALEDFEAPDRIAGFIPKPFKPMALAGAIDKILQGHGVMP